MSVEKISAFRSTKADHTSSNTSTLPAKHKDIPAVDVSRLPASIPSVTQQKPPGYTQKQASEEMLKEEAKLTVPLLLPSYKHNLDEVSNHNFVLCVCNGFFLRSNWDCLNTFSCLITVHDYATLICDT